MLKYMKNTIIVLIYLVLVISLCACGADDGNAENDTSVNIVETTAAKSNMVLTVEEAIAMIGTVDYDSLDEIENAEKLYDYLTDNEKEHVENRLDLFNARETYDNLPPQRPEFQDDEILALYAMNSMINDYLLIALKNPGSLSVNGLAGGVNEDGTYIFNLDYSAENGFGGTVRDNLYIAVERTEKGFSTTSYGTRYFYEDDSQMYTKLFFNSLSFVKEYDVKLLYEYMGDLWSFVE